MKRIGKFSFIILVTLMTLTVEAARLKDIANIRGMRSNQLVGYGLVVGLNGTGDGAAPFTQESTKRMLSKLGVKMDQAQAFTSGNIAAVLITAELPAFAKSGNEIDVVVNAIGNAKSLKGGTLVQSPLRAADQKVYVVAQGPVRIDGGTKNKMETVGRVVNGGIIERDVGEDFSNRKMYRLSLHEPDFTTSLRVEKTINKELGGKYASASDGSTIDVVTPADFEGKGVQLLSRIERMDVSPDQKARVIINEKTGTVIMGDQVEILPIAISHGDLSIKVKKRKGQNEERGLASGPGGKKKEKTNKVYYMKKGSSVGEIVKAMNYLGVTPKDLIAILQNIKAAGALQADLEVL